MAESQKREREMFEKSFQRPSNYFKLGAERQWEIDKELGILDWVGEGLSKEEIRTSWAEDLEAFKGIRRRYLIYPE